MIYFKIAFRNIIKNWRQSLATLISISAAFFTLVCFQGYLQEVEDLFIDIYRNREMFGDIMIENKDLYSTAGYSEPWKFYLTLDDQKYLQELLQNQKEKILAQVKFLKYQGMITNGKTSLIAAGHGYEVVPGEIMRGETWAWNSIYGSPLTVENADRSLLIGQTLAKLLACEPDKQRLKSSLTEPPKFFKIGFHCENDNSNFQISAMTFDGQVNAIDLDAVGIIDGGFKEVDSKYTVMSLKSVQDLLNTNLISQMTVMLKDDRLTSYLISEWQKKSDQDGRNFKFISWMDHPIYGDAYISSMQILSVFRNFVVVIILTIATLSVLNTLIKVVKERTKEIGTLRSLGFLRRQIYTIFAIESLGLAFLGVAIGAICSIAFSIFINNSGLDYKAGLFVEPAPLRIVISFSIYFSSLMFLTLLSLVSSLIAVRTVVVEKITENLSYA